MPNSKARAGIELNGNGIPPFESLPLRKEDPYLSAWGLYGDDDELGTLNRLSGDIVVRAKEEIRNGTRISMNWPLSAQTQSKKAFFQRALFHQEIIHKKGRTVNDDIWTFNTQISSQWDGLRHYGYQKEGKFYNGVTLEDIHGPGFEAGNKTMDSTTTVNGIQAMAEQGIVGRGILLDYHSWRLAQTPPIPYSAFTHSSIPISHLLAVAAAQRTEIHFGDILLIRSGYFVEQNQKSEEELSILKDQGPPNFGGVEQSVEVLRWIWDNFSAVAGDQPSFESWPTQKSFSLHEVLLAGWGMPIGELFDLEKLAEQCKKEQRWSFFVASEVCNVPGGVASPPNILAIF